MLVGKSPDGVQHPNGDVLNTTDQWKRNGGGEIQVYMKEAYKNFPYVAYGDGGMDGDYVPKLKEMVTKFNTKYPDLKDDIVWIPFNEPDISDANYYNLTNYNSKYDSVRTKFFEDWNKAVEAIRSVYPQARIGGPNNSAYSDRFYRDFFQNAKEHGTVPDVVTWHELGSGFGSYLSNFQKWKTLEKDVLSDYAPPETTGLKQGQTIKEGPERQGHRAGQTWPSAAVRGPLRKDRRPGRSAVLVPGRRSRLAGHQEQPGDRFLLAVLLVRAHEGRSAQGRPA